MHYEVYCDENHPELLTSKSPKVRYMLIGSLWLPTTLRSELKQKVWELRALHNTWGEIKWQKVSHKKLDFYQDLLDLFQSYGEELRFRCIVIDSQTFDKRWHRNDNELSFYKFYYQLLHHWILDFNAYHIFCDIKTNRDLTRLALLKECLKNSNLSADIVQLQSLPSQEVVLIQLCDLLLGIASARLNQTLQKGSAKEYLVQRVERHLGHTLSSTPCSEHKFNIFQINLKGGW